MRYPNTGAGGPSDDGVAARSHQEAIARIDSKGYLLGDLEDIRRTCPGTAKQAAPRARQQENGNGLISGQTAVKAIYFAFFKDVCPEPGLHCQANEI